MGSSSNSSGRGRGRPSAGTDENEEAEQDDENGYEVYFGMYCLSTVYDALDKLSFMCTVSSTRIQQQYVSKCTPHWKYNHH
eukprot:14532-Heterococcus_DN1.PRE.1